MKKMRISYRAAAVLFTLSMMMKICSIVILCTTFHPGHVHASHHPHHPVITPEKYNRKALPIN